MIKLDFAIFAIHATIQPDGVFSVLNGGLEWVSAKAFPANCPNLALLARFSFDASEVGRERTCAVNVTGPDANELQPQLRILLTPTLNERHPDIPSTFTVIYAYDRFVIPSPGLYRFALMVDDDTLGEVILKAVLEPNL